MKAWNEKGERAMTEQRGWYDDVLGKRKVEGGHSGPDPKYSHFAEKETSGKNIPEKSTIGMEASSSPARVDWDQIKGLVKPYEAMSQPEISKSSEHERSESKAERREE